MRLRQHTVPVLFALHLLAVVVVVFVLHDGREADIRDRLPLLGCLGAWFVLTIIWAAFGPDGSTRGILAASVLGLLSGGLLISCLGSPWFHAPSLGVAITSGVFVSWGPAAWILNRLARFLPLARGRLGYSEREYDSNQSARHRFQRGEVLLFGLTLIGLMWTLWMIVPFGKGPRDPFYDTFLVSLFLCLGVPVVVGWIAMAVTFSRPADWLFFRQPFTAYMGAIALLVIAVAGLVLPTLDMLDNKTLHSAFGVGRTGQRRIYTIVCLFTPLAMIGFTLYVMRWNGFRLIAPGSKQPSADKHGAPANDILEEPGSSVRIDRALLAAMIAVVVVGPGFWLTGMTERIQVYNKFFGGYGELFAQSSLTLTDSDLRVVATFVGLAPLNYLSLHKQDAITDTGLGHLKDLTKLERLNLHGTQVTDAGLVHLGAIPQLISLDLSNTQITDAGLSRLSGHGQLFGLTLDDTQITDAGLVHLKEMTELTDLHISNTRVTDAGLRYLAGVINLRSLGVVGLPITDAGLVHLKEMTELTNLNISNTRVTDAGLVHLKGLTKLQWLYLMGTKVTYAGVADLKKALPNCKISK